MTCPPQAALRLDAVLEPTAGPEAAAALERIGFAGAWVTETVRDPYLVLAGAAAATCTLGLGTAVAIAFARSPMLTALSAHDVQRLTASRLRLGLGSQARAHITRRFSMPWSHPTERTREYVAAVRAIWTSWNDHAPLRFSGEFYQHTLMTPFFDPGSSGYPPPPILLGGVGARMTATAGEVAGGLICGPLTSGRRFHKHTMPALRRGWGAAPGPRANAFEVCVMPLVVTGADRADTDRVARATRARIALYASTPAYRSIFELHGWGALADQLHPRSINRDWEQMGDLVDDEVLDAFAVIAEPGRMRAALTTRFGDLADRAILSSAADLAPDVWATVLAEPSDRSGT